MTSYPLAWIVASALLLAGLYVTKSAYSGHLARLKEMHWRGLVIIAVIGGAILAYVFVTATAPKIPLPPELTDSPQITTPAAKK